MIPYDRSRCGRVALGGAYWHGLRGGAPQVQGIGLGLLFLTLAIH